MHAPRIWLAGALFFLCTWTSLLARLKGYNAICWCFAGGPLGVLLLWRLRPAGSIEPKARSRANRLGLILSAFSLATAWACRGLF